MGLNDSVNTINNLIRTILAAIVVLGIGGASFMAYSAYTAGQRQEADLKNARETVEQQRATLEAQAEQLKAKEQILKNQQVEITSLTEEVAVKQQEIDRLDTAMRLLKVDRRVAYLSVLDQTPNPDGKGVISRLKFVEVDDNNKEMNERTFEINGDIIYVDSWVAKFEDRYVESGADELRSTTMVMFRRLFGENQSPTAGVELDQRDKRPKIYGKGEMSDFEKRIWKDFWTIANDRASAEKIGIRAAHGNAVSMRVQKGMRYKIQLRSSDGLSIIPDGKVAIPQPAT